MLWATKFELSITLITFAHLIKYNQYHEIVTESPMNRPNYNFISITQCYTHPTEIISTNIVKFLFFVTHSTLCLKKATLMTDHHAKFCQNRSIHCWDNRDFFRFFKMAAICHFGFVWSICGPLAQSTSWSLSLCLIWLRLMQ